MAIGGEYGVSILLFELGGCSIGASRAGLNTRGRRRVCHLEIREFD